MEDSRHNARILLIQKFFEEYFHEQKKLSPQSDIFKTGALTEASELKKYSKTLFDKIASEYPNHKDKIDLLITKLAPEWPLNKISLIDLQILRLAILEGFILKITPVKVAIDEAIELSKEFSNDQSRKFVSGVLGNLYDNREKYL